MCRFRFNTCVRLEGESITAFVTRLCDLASNCEYSDSARELIRDRLVCGVRDDTLQRTLLAVSKLTFDKAYELSLLHESAAQNARLLSEPSTVPVHFTDPPKNPPSGSSCYRCGGNHYVKDCRFKDAICNYCRKKGHIRRVCRTRMQQQSRNSQPSQPPPAKPPRKGRDQPTHKMEGEPESASGSSTSCLATPQVPQVPPAEPLLGNYDIFAVGTDKKSHPYMVSVCISGATLQMEIDTGSVLSLVSQEVFSRLWPPGKSPHWRVRLSNSELTQERNSGWWGGL